METKTSTVTQVTPNGTWDSNYGTMYRFEVTFENGDMGEYSSKNQNQDKFVVGKMATYEATTREYKGNTYLTVKPVAAQGGTWQGGGKKDPATEQRITRMNVLQRAVDMYLHEKIDEEEILIYADVFEKFVNGQNVTMPSSVHGGKGLPF